MPFAFPSITLLIGLLFGINSTISAQEGNNNEDVIPISCGTVYNSELLPDSGSWTNYTGSSWNYNGSEKVWSFTPSTTGDFTFVLDEGSNDADFFLMDSNSNTATNISSGYWSGLGNETIHLTGGETYYLIADLYSSSSTTVSVEVLCLNQNTGGQRAQGDIIPTACDNATYTLDPGSTINFYDDGGPGGDCDNSGASGNFANANCETITTICPAPGETISVHFSVLSMFGTNSGFDWLVIYEGSNTSGNILFDNRSGGPDNPYGTSCNFDGNDRFCVPDKCLTFRFFASGVVNREGWEATVTSTPFPELEFTENNASCSGNNFSQIDNYNSDLTYTITPSGASIDGSGKITGDPGTYTVTVENNGGCTYTEQTTLLEEQDSPTISVSATDPANCGDDGTINFTFTDVDDGIYDIGGFTGVAVSGGTASVNAPAGTYNNLEITNQDGCTSDTESISLTDPNAPDVPNIDITAPTCTADGSAEVLNYDNNVSYTFSPTGPTVNGSGDISGANFGQNYTIEADLSGCISSTSFQVEEQLDAPNMPTFTVTDPTCVDDGFAQIDNYDNTLTYSSAPAGASIDPGGEITGADGTYTITVENDEGCTNSDDVTIEEQVSTPDDPIIDITDPTCDDDGFAEITNFDAAYTYDFTPAGPTVGTGGTITGATHGENYDVTANIGGCSSATVNFTTEAQLEQPTFTITKTDPTCGSSDGEIVITPDAGLIITDYSIDNGTNTQSGGTFSNLGGGSYDILIIADNGCEKDSTIILSSASGPSIDNISTTDASCDADDGTITVSASGGSGSLSYELDNGDTSNDGTFTGLADGDYTVTVTDDNGCETTQTVTVGKVGGFNFTVDNSTDASCFGEADGSAEVSANGGTTPYTYDWSPEGGTNAAATDLPAGTYTVTATDDAGCIENIQITIAEPDSIIIDETITNTDCEADNGEIALAVTGGTGNYTYTWNPNVSTSDQATGLGLGIYEVTVTDDDGCGRTVSYNVIQNNSFYIETIPEDSTTILQGESVDLNLFIEPNTEVEDIIWTPAEGLSCWDCKDPTATPQDSTTYIVAVTDTNGCIATDSVKINVVLPCADIFVPNTFSPNKDGLNDLQCVFGECIVTLDFTIFNRWGETVFKTGDQEECWDGTYRGKAVQSGTYVYKLKATLDDGTTVEESGNITVVR